MQPVRLGTNELLIRLASGGAANVFLVRDLASPKQDRLLALKILLPSLASNDDFLNMFFTEARIASRLSHDNVVAITGFGQVEGIHCLAMDYVFGASLAQVLRASARAKKPLTVGVLLRITAAVCDALHFAHEMRDEGGESMGLVHRDVTPQNILIGFNGVPKLTDFGIAKATGRGWETQAGIVKGKFSYMSPEQALGKKVDRRSDIFGTGIVLWEALTGRDLFKGSTPMEVLAAIREQKIEPPSKVVPGLTPIVDPIVMKALRRSPRQRYATAADMRDEILDLIHRAGVEIDASTISKEFYAIYGEEIGSRAVELRKAMAGKADVEALAKVLGGQALNPKHLPVIPGGVTDPDPLGLFGDEVGPVPVEPAPAQGTRTDFEIVDEVSDISPQPRQMDAGEETAEGHPTDWNEAQPAHPEDDELLSMLSEEDATVGLLPKEFAARFGARLEQKRSEELRHGSFDDDEKTIGAPDAASIGLIRSVGDDPEDDEPRSVWEDDPPTYYDEPPRAQVPPDPLAAAAAAEARRREVRESAEHRPVPRAPSLDIREESAERTHPFPRAPSLDIHDDRTPAPQFDSIAEIPVNGVARLPEANAPEPARPEIDSSAQPAPSAQLAPSAVVGSAAALTPTADPTAGASGVHLGWPSLVLGVIGLVAMGFAAGYMSALY